MLDFFSILSKGGLVLWYFQAGFKNMQDNQNLFWFTICMKKTDFLISKIGLRLAPAFIFEFSIDECQNDALLSFEKIFY